MQMLRTDFKLKVVPETTPGKLTMAELASARGVHWTQIGARKPQTFGEPSGDAAPYGSIRTRCCKSPDSGQSKYAYRAKFVLDPIHNIQRQIPGKRSRHIGGGFEAMQLLSLRVKSGLYKQFGEFIRNQAVSRRLRTALLHDRRGGHAAHGDRVPVLLGDLWAS